MKRTNLVLNEDLLKTATQILGAKTYSEAVNRSLEECIRMNKIRNLNNLFGLGIWEGNLSEMRKDSGKSSKEKHR